MKKVIVTRDNYEEVMFGLLEDEYPKDVRNNILDQIQADTFLNFEWQQWSKAHYSEGIEMYKSNEAAFIEGLTKEEKKKRGLMYYMVPMAVAASVLLLLGLYIGFYKTPTGERNMVDVIYPGQLNNKESKLPIGDTAINTLPMEKNIAGKSANAIEPNKVINGYQIPQTEVRDTLLLVEEKKEIIEETQAQRDTIRTMIAAAQKRPRYKVTIIENQSAEDAGKNYKFVEKRYSMADVLSKKDGISLSKFLQSPNTRIVTDKNTNIVTIEYTATDHSVLVLTLSN